MEPKQEGIVLLCCYFQVSVEQMEKLCKEKELKAKNEVDRGETRAKLNCLNIQIRGAAPMTFIRRFLYVLVD